MADSSLEAVIKKVRHLTRSPSPNQITDDEIKEYVNTFVLYDFPEHLRLFALRTTFTFYTEPYIDEYDSDNPAIQLDDFKNKYISIHEPIYIDGQRVYYYQDRDQFYSNYPRTNIIENLGEGDGVTLVFDGTLASYPIIKNNVLFSSVATDNSSVELHDFVGGTGTTAFLGGSGFGTINYVTGAYSLNFTTAPADGAQLNAHTIPYIPTKPDALLYFDNKFTVRPVPDQAYRVDMEVYRRPTELLAGQSPELDQWKDYISYGAAKKVLEDRLDIETVALLMPEFKQQGLLVNRRNVTQRAQDKVKTMFNSGAFINRSPFRRW